MLNRILNKSAEDYVAFGLTVCLPLAAGLGPADGIAEALAAVRLGPTFAFPDIIFSLIIVVMLRLWLL